MIGPGPWIFFVEMSNIALLGRELAPIVVRDSQFQLSETPSSVQ